MIEPVVNVFIWDPEEKSFVHEDELRGEEAIEMFDQGHRVKRSMEQAKIGRMHLLQFADREGNLLKVWWSVFQCPCEYQHDGIPGDGATVSIVELAHG